MQMCAEAKEESCNEKEPPTSTPDGVMVEGGEVEQRHAHLRWGAESPTRGQGGGFVTSDLDGSRSTKWFCLWRNVEKRMIDSDWLKNEREVKM
jgi:hypothetical protein